MDDTLEDLSTHLDQRGTEPSVGSPRLAALLLVAALLPAVLASWSVGPLSRVQTALVEASRAPAGVEARPVAAQDGSFGSGEVALPSGLSTAPLCERLCEALRGRPDLCATPPPAQA